MRAVLDSQRGLGGGSYPVPVTRLFELACVSMSDTALKVFVAPKNARLFTLTAKSSRNEPDATQRALVFLPEDGEMVAGSAAIFNKAFEAAKATGSDLFTPAELAKHVAVALRTAFRTSVEEWAGTGKAPFPRVLVLRRKGPTKTDVYLHRLEAPAAMTRVKQPSASISHDGFAHEFAREFERLDRASGNNNYVLLHDLRRALPDVDRAEFDNRLKELRLAKLFTLDSPDGRHVRLSPEQLEAGIREGGSNLVYVARR